MSKESDRYEEVTRSILNDCRKQLGFNRVEPKGHHTGESGTPWEIDVTCYLDETDGKILVECRRHTTSKIDQGQVAEVLGRIIETNAEGAIIVTPVGYQKGAKLVAKAHKITLATLDADATEREYILEICDLLFRGIEARGGMAVGTSADVGVKYNIFGSGGIVIG